MGIPTRAYIALEAWKDSTDDPLDLSWLDNPYWWDVMPPQIKNMDRTLARRYMEQALEEQKRPAQFIKQVALLFPNSGFERIDIMHIAMDNPNAVCFYDSEDSSYAIGLDHVMKVIFSSVFSSLLYAAIKKKRNLSWVMALHDVVIMHFAKLDNPKMDQRILERGQEEAYLAPITSAAANMAEQFIIAHELGHVHLEHFQKEEALRLTAKDGTHEDVISRFQQSTEFEADAWAAQLLVKIAGEDPIKKALAYQIPSIYFAFMSLKEQIYVPRKLSIRLGIFEQDMRFFVPDEVSLGERLENTHPDPWERAKQLEPRIRANQEQLRQPLSQELNDLYERVERERQYPPFQAAAARIRGLLATYPSRPEILRKKIPFGNLQKAYVFSLEHFVLYRRVVGLLNVFYYVPCIAIAKLHSEYPASVTLDALLVLWSALGSSLALACFWVARKALIWRAHIGAVGEALGILTGTHVSMVKVLFWVSGLFFVIVPTGLILWLAFF